MVELFKIEYTHYLDPEGKPIQTLPEWAEDNDQLLKLYYYLTLTRTFDDRAIKLQRTGKLGTYASSLGQEAIAVGFASAMEKDDLLVPYYRDCGAQLQRGVSLSELFMIWNGCEWGHHYKNSHDLPNAIPIASQALHAAGVAKAFQYRKQKHVVVTSCGDGATSEGDFYEAMNLAGAWNLPIVFIVNNNQWAISVPRSAQTHATTIAQKAIAAGFKGIQVDGYDVIAVSEVTRQALEKARSGKGPTLIEAMSYRLCDHTTADDADRYRDKSALEDAWKKEPIKRLRAYLINQGSWDDDKEAACIKKCGSLIESAFEESLTQLKQNPESTIEYLYETLPEAYMEQWQALRDAGEKS